MKELITLLHGIPVGVLQQNRSGYRTFEYLPDVAAGYSLSLALPLRAEPYRQGATDPFIDGLVPEGEGVRQTIARQYNISARNSFALLEYIGLDCAGAVQFCHPEEISSVIQRRGELLAIPDQQIGERLRSLIAQPDGSWTVGRERWSLAGAQSKFALRWNDGWHEATGSEPNTHIFKPGIHDFKDQALNEHLCLRTLGQVGLNVARTAYTDFDGTPALVVQRYDRVSENTAVDRLHQEDFCQATSTLPHRKYESDRGPSALTIIRTLRSARAPEAEVKRFVEALVANYLLGAPDAHAKNYSILLYPSGEVRLAPLYDIASGFPYERTRDSGVPTKDDGLREAAMAIGGERRFGRVARRHWQKFAADASVDGSWLVATVRGLAEKIPPAMEEVIDEEQRATQGSDLPSRLVEPVTHNCAATLTLLDR